jgi:hypothetical protein
MSASVQGATSLQTVIVRGVGAVTDTGILAAVTSSSGLCVDNAAFATQVTGDRLSIEPRVQLELTAYQLLATPDKTRPAQTEVMNLVLKTPPFCVCQRAIAPASSVWTTVIRPRQPNREIAYD